MKVTIKAQMGALQAEHHRSPCLPPSNQPQAEKVGLCPPQTDPRSCQKACGLESGTQRSYHQLTAYSPTSLPLPATPTQRPPCRPGWEEAQDTVRAGPQSCAKPFLSPFEFVPFSNLNYKPSPSLRNRPRPRTAPSYSFLKVTTGGLPSAVPRTRTGDQSNRLLKT